VYHRHLFRRASHRVYSTRAPGVVTSLATVAALEDVAQRIAKRSTGEPLIVIETSTLPIEDKARAMKVVRRCGAVMLDCPISGTAVRMKEGAWTIFVSGDAAASKRVAPVLQVFTRTAPYVARFPNGMRMKFIANHLVAIYNVAVGESLTFARGMGLDAQAVWDMFASNSVVGTGVAKLRGKLMVERRYEAATMKVEVWQKDMQVIGAIARAVGAPTPLLSACAPIYNAAMANGLGQHDTASVCEVLGDMAGMPGPLTARPIGPATVKRRRKVR
jgi:putative dehydrogenase